MRYSHNYLFEPGLWSAKGLFYDRQENPHSYGGEIVVIHEPGLWTIETRMNISGEDKRDFEARYEVVPFSENKNYTEWKSMTGGPEPLFGLFVVVEDTILTPSQSRSGVYWGQEAHIRVGKGEYSNRGFSFLKDEKVSSWSMRLIKEN